MSKEGLYKNPMVRYGLGDSRKAFESVKIRHDLYHGFDVEGISGKPRCLDPAPSAYTLALIWLPGDYGSIDGDIKWLVGQADRRTDAKKKSLSTTKYTTTLHYTVHSYARINALTLLCARALWD